jgi:GYF domain 2/von Willebrand factor type A domain
MPQWYYTRGGQTFGPLPLAELRRLAAERRLRPDDLVAQEGNANWAAASTIRGLFPAAPMPVATVTAAPAKPVHAVTAAAPAPAPAPAGRNLVASLLVLLPKPLLFALFGGIGGLLGAVVLGELAWLILSPARLREPDPHVRMAIPESLRVYAGGKNYFIARVARDGFEGPITISAVNPREGLTVDPVEVPANVDEVSIDVAAAGTLPPGKVALRFRAGAPQGSKAYADFADLELSVEPPPATLRIAAPPKLTLYVGGKGRFLVRIGRTNFTQPVALALRELPEGAAAAPVLAGAAADEAWIEVTAVEGMTPGTWPIHVAAQSDLPQGPLNAATDLELEVLPLRVPKVDIFFVLDLTNSMQFAINGIKDGIQNFASQLGGRKLDARIGLVGFRDIEDDRERPFVVSINGEALTRDYATFRAEVGKLKARGGGDDPESSLQALAFAADQPFRPDAAKVLLLITDAMPKLHPKERIKTVDDVLQVFKERQIDQLHLVVHQRDLRDAYGRFQKELHGSFLDLNRAKDSAAFVKILPELSDAISRITTASAVSAPEPISPAPLPSMTAEPLAAATNTTALKAVQSTETYSAADRWRLLFALAVWTMIVAVAICMLIIAGQALYARQGLPTLSEAGRGVAGGVLAGLVGGAFSQLVFQTAFGGQAAAFLSGIGQLLGWTLLGGLLGLGIAFFVPNLKWYRGSAGGVLGGFLGGLAFVLLSVVLGLLMPAWVGGILGRWIGAAIVGFCIGLMIALAELVFRRQWLEISFGPREVRTVTLGSVPVTIGGNERHASVFVAGAAPIALRFSVQDGRVLCEDAVAKTTTEILPGGYRAIGKVRVAVGSTAQAKQIGYRLQLSSGKSIMLAQGLPLTADDLPGLSPAGKDGIVALIATHPSNPGALLLRNRSAQSWSSESRDGILETIEPGRSIAVEDGLRIALGTVKGTLKRAH